MLIYLSLGDTYEIYVSPFDFVKIFIIYLFIIIYLLGDTYVDVSPFDFVKIFFIIFIFIILPRICSQDISRLNKAIIMNLSLMIDLSLT